MGKQKKSGIMKEMHAGLSQKPFKDLGPPGGTRSFGDICDQMGVSLAKFLQNREKSHSL